MAASKFPDSRSLALAVSHLLELVAMAEQRESWDTDTALRWELFGTDQTLARVIGVLEEDRQERAWYRDRVLVSNVLEFTTREALKASRAKRRDIQAFTLEWLTAVLEEIPSLREAGIHAVMADVLKAVEKPSRPLRDARRRVDYRDKPQVGRKNRVARALGKYLGDVHHDLLLRLEAVGHGKPRTGKVTAPEELGALTLQPMSLHAGPALSTALAALAARTCPWPLPEDVQESVDEVAYRAARMLGRLTRRYRFRSRLTLVLRRNMQRDLRRRRWVRRKAGRAVRITSLVREFERETGEPISVSALRNIIVELGGKRTSDGRWLLPMRVATGKGTKALARPRRGGRAV